MKTTKKAATLKLTRETHGFCSCTNLPAVWQMTSIELGMLLGTVLFFGLLGGAYLMTLVLS